MKRRDFLSTALAVAASGLAARSTRAADGLVEVLLDEPIGMIAPELQGQFSEHIGEVIYNGVWVGENSKIPNIGGIRKALVERMRQIRVPVVRWPGGCFGDSYNWRDGVGPRAQRPVRTSFWQTVPDLAKAPDGPQKWEPNTFGTADFARFCQLSGAQPYLSANVRSLTPLDFDQWVEYCNSPAGTTTLAQTRAGDGSREPFNVKFWGMGNESWGCGGNMRGGEYSMEFRRFTAWVPDYGQKLHFIASGPGADERDSQVVWTREFFENLVGKSTHLFNRVYGFALHYYCNGTEHDDAINFSLDDWYLLLRQADYMDPLLQQHWTVMGEYDPARKVKLVVDEWGAFHHSTALGPQYLWSYVPSLRDALLSAIHLDIFNRNADKLAMCNVSQLVNNINTLFLTRDEQLVLTTVFHVFDMYKSHQGGRSVRLVFDAPSITAAPAPGGSDASARTNLKNSLWGLGGSASVQDKTLVLTVVNPHASEARQADVSLRGGAARSAQVTVLTAPDIHAHNDFDQPDAVVPKIRIADISGRRFAWTFPAASVTKFEITLE